MSDDYILKYTNGYANYSKIDDAELTIEGDCKITNYDPRVDDGKSKGEITINFSGGEQTVKAGTGNGYTQTQKANFSKKKFSIFKEIAALDGDAKELSVEDIKKMDKSLIQKWGLKDLRFDFKNGVATLVWGENDILRIDFVTKNEKKSFPTETNSSSAASSKSTTATTSSNSTQENATQKVAGKLQVAEAISNFKGGNIDISQVKDLETVAKYTGISESYIREVLVGLEGKNKWPLCVAEYDNVPAKGHPKGFLTIGFGHTSLVGEPSVTEGLEISEKQAYQILANDIMTSRQVAINKLKNRGIKFAEVPHSIQCSIIDLVFNKGPSEINESLVANLKNKYYGAATRRTWYDTNNVGLQKRNMYRFISALEDLNQTTKQVAIKRFRSDHLHQLLAVFKKDIDAKTAWNNMCETVSYQVAKF